MKIEHRTIRVGNQTFHVSNRTWWTAAIVPIALFLAFWLFVVGSVLKIIYELAWGGGLCP